ncbi:hypothetical protein [Pseudonocardia broussonetiae]|uniref:Uncharacterized protein n=1 Tax=Pseudonocardia broussonetiae TaxID=2736640 RepID=A0A6M6JGH7_9PSEU|nr:hypothetical protein [Pseudonocardia broussonetiae]QJY47104.1 hypothetical protein HOP40_15870 [Pseudonocardia broussonetiae]
MTIRLFPAPPPLSGDAPALDYGDRARCLAAAHRARRTYPGPLGELVARELTSYAEFGHRFGDGLIPRLVAAVLSEHVDSASEPGSGPRA